MQTVARLISFFAPDNYTLSLQLDRTARSFKGVVDIHGFSTPNANRLILHAKDLFIESVLFDGKTAEFHLDGDELTITHKDLVEGKHVVTVSFIGNITDAMHGLYPCYYESNGQKKELLATQFESHHAREVFPCIDEPEAKATFDVRLTTEKDIVVLGNMPTRQQMMQDDQLITIFQTTPRMSTYLLAWVTGDLHCKTATTKSEVEVNVWATPAQRPESLDFALEHAVRTIEFFDDYFGTPYPLPKLDLVALPDFTNGAMENWGLITYREVALLADPQTAGISNRQYIALVIAHEVSHQWFGNLVTMKWWNGLWLNESFATLMEYIAVDALHPDWNIWLDFSTMESILALRRDSIDGVQSVQIDVHHPDEIGALFDGAIVYAKGARLLRMLQHYIGHEAFQAGLKAYFVAYAYQNTEGDDLWQALAAASGKDIAQFMSTWILQPGYPVVNITVNGTDITLSQQQFFIGPHQQVSRTWPIPLNASQPHFPELLETSTMTISRSSDKTLRFNVGDTAHFITAYSSELMEELITAVKQGQLSSIDRLQLLHEQTLLARAGIISSAALIPLLIAYNSETEEAVWNIIALAAGELRKFTETDAKSEENLRKLYLLLARKPYERLGWEASPNEPESDTKLRATIIDMMLYSEDNEVIKKALKLYHNNSLEALDPELRPLIIGVAVRESTEDTVLAKLINLYRASSSADLREDIASGITMTRSEGDIRQIISLFKDAHTVRSQDLTKWFAWTIRNRYGREPAWKWLQDNWSWIKRKFSGDMSYDYYPRYSAGALMTRQQLEEFRAFFTPMLNEPALTRVITLGISEIEARANLLERDTSAIRQTLAKL
jgi:aminopeptidase N